MKKVIYLLNIDNYAPEITELTYPLIYRYADKINAEVFQIKERKFPSWPLTYEKLQIYELGKLNKADWNIYIDSDALIHPDMVDVTVLAPKDTVLHNGADMASVRWTYDNYFLRDGRHIGSCNWLAVASDWCLDLWHPLDDLTPEEAIKNIHPTQTELDTVIKPEHLVDDYALSRNIARYGLKFRTLMDIFRPYGEAVGFGLLYHQYIYTRKEKETLLKDQLKQWGLYGK